MLRQNTNQTFMQVSLAFLLSLCSLSAFSEGTKYLLLGSEFSYQQDSYTVRVVKKQCVKSATPEESEVSNKRAVKATIIYYKTTNFCDIRSSYLEYEVRGIQRYDYVSYFRWIKYPGKDPKIEIDPGMNPLGLVKVYDLDELNGGKTITVSIGYKGHH